MSSTVRILDQMALVKLLVLSSILAGVANCQNDLPNIVIFIADDLDSELGGDAPLEKAHGWINDNGVTFNNAFVAVPVCCPSRASLLTGLYQHNHGVLNNTVEGDCCGDNWRADTELRTYASYLKGAGYVSFYGGKYMNGYGLEAGGGLEHVPNGWDDWVALKGNSVYYNYNLSVNGQLEAHGSNYEEDYLTDVISRKADEFLDFYLDNIGSNNLPFLMVLAPPAPHDPYTPAPQYEDSYPDAEAPRTPAFNYVEDDKHWLMTAPGPRPLDDGMVELVDEVYRDRLRTMLSVDDMIDHLLTRLEDTGNLDNTYVVLISDHGYHVGQFGMAREKRMPYDFDLRIPLAVRGPGVRQNVEEDAVVTAVDFAPTVLEMAGVEVPQEMDGTSFFSWLQDYDEADPPPSQHSFLVSYHGEGDISIADECEEIYDATNLSFCDSLFGCQCFDSRNNTYTCLRTFSSEENTLFCQYEDDDNFEEFYDLQLDPYQLTNTVSDLDGELRDDYIDKMESLKICSGSADCFRP